MHFATSEDITVVNNVLSAIPRPTKIKIDSNCSTSTLCEAGLISNINFTDYLLGLKLIEIRLTAKCATEIAESLHQAPNLQNLDLSGNPLHSSVCDLAKNIHHVPELTHLKLKDVQMGEKECIVLASSLNNMNKLQVLKIGNNPLGHGIMALVRHLSCLPKLIVLDLTDTEMGEEEATAVARCLPSLSQLQMIDLSYNPLGQGIIELAKHLNCLSELIALTLQHVEMGENQVTAVARCLPHLSKLKKIDLSGNPLGHGIIELARHLKCLPDLTELELDKTEMGAEEATALALCLPSLSQLKRLSLPINPLGQGVIQLAERLKCVPNLEELELYSTRMGKVQVSALARALKHVPKLRTLNLLKNPLGRGVSVLIQHLSSVPELRELCLRDVKMTKKEAQDLSTVRGLVSDYHITEKETGDIRLCTEAELKAGGRWADDSKYDVVPITFDEE